MPLDCLRVLVTDDEPYICELLNRFLESEGYECESVLSADAALERLAEGPYALLVSDINMPGKSGLELLAEVRSLHPDVAVIMLTGVDDRKTAIQALHLGAYGYVIKPFDLNELAIDVANAFERRRLTLLSRANQERLETEVRRRTAQIRLREEEIAVRLVAAAEYRDSDTGQHIRRIGLYSAELAKHLGWEVDKIDDLRIAAMMHDLGKIGVPDSILRKAGPLTAEERSVIEQHTVIGARILESSKIPMVEMARKIALYHHEWWDGTGYPTGLNQNTIPQSARIVAVVDVYDALVHERVYRPAIPEPKVLEMMEGERERHFDPEVFTAFLECLPRVRAIRYEVPSN